MDNMKNGVHADTAEAENTETMDLLAGMLDASTHCGDNDEDDKEPAQAVEETPGEESAPENNNRREKTDSSIQRAKCADSPHTYPYPAYWAEAGRRRIQANNTTNIIPH